MGGSYFWILGVLLATTGSIVSNLGVNFQKLAHKKMADLGEKGSYTKNKYWIVGLVMVIIGSFADFAALTFAPQSLVAPLGSMTLVTNSILAPLLIGEKVVKRDLLATAVIIFGSVLAVTFASHTDVVYSTVDLFAFYFHADFLIYIISVLAFIFYLHWKIRKIEVYERISRTSPEYVKHRLFHRFAYPAMSGSIGAQSVLFAKCVCELLVNSVEGNGVLFTYWQSYIVITCMFVCIGLQIKWINEGLARFDASYTVPVFTSFWILLSIISGMVFYREWVGMKVAQSVMFVIGVFITLGGVIALSKREVNTGQESDDDRVSLRPLVGGDGLDDSYDSDDLDLSDSIDV